MALYLYGIVPAASGFERFETPGVAGGRVRILDVEGLACVVGELDDVPFRARRGDLMAHSDVLQEAIESADVVPMRFGTVFASTDELLNGFLRPNRDELAAILDRVHGAVEVQVKGEYDADAVAREIVSRDRRTQKLTARARERGDVDSNIELGRRFAAVLEQTRNADARKIVDALAPAADDVALGEVSGEYGVINASFLVPRERVARFAVAVAEVRSRFGDRVKLRELGPLPPYSFVDAGSMVMS
jgi:Gas vesicle synthesis protein GvpL/GvpF